MSRVSSAGTALQNTPELCRAGPPAPASYGVLHALRPMCPGDEDVIRGADGIVVLIYIALYQTPVEGLLTIFVYAVGFSSPSS